MNHQDKLVMVASLPEQRSQIPRNFGIIDRPRLLEKLQGAADHKLTLVSAPPGYGKTTLVAQFARQTHYPVAWHSIEERERDVPNLYTQAVSVLENIAPGIGKLKPAYGYTPEELATLIAEYVRDNVKRDVFYVLDDVQYLAGATGAEIWLRTLVARLPGNCHLIMISRILPDLPFAEMIVRREVLAIGQEELRLTATEIAALAYQVLGFAPSTAQVQDLVARLEGWPAGTVLALYPLPPDLERAMLSGGQGPEALFDALADSMLHTQPVELRDFLLASSTLPRLTPELCSDALGLRDTAVLLSEVQNRNLFLSRITRGLAYHRLFRSFLQRQLHNTDPNLYASLHAKAARWFEENDYQDEAFDHYLTAGLPQRAADISQRLAHAYFTQGKTETLLYWSRQLHQADLGSPRLFWACAMVHTDRYEYGMAEDELYAAEKGFYKQRDYMGLIDVQIQRAMIDLQRGDYHAAINLAEQVMEMGAVSTKIRGNALKILGVAHLRLGEVDDALSCLEDAIPLHRADGDAYALANVLQDLGVVLARIGRLEEASACLQEVVALRRSLGSAQALALALNNLGYYYHRGSDYRQAMLTLQEGLSVVAKVPNRRAESYLLWSIADLQRDQNAWDDAMRSYQKALELLGSGEPALRSSILVGISTLHRWRGEFYKAVTAAKEAAALAETHKLALESALAQSALWSAYVSLGQEAESLMRLEGVASLLLKQKARYELLRVYGMCAHAALLMSDTTAAEQYLLSALQLAGEVGSAQPLVSEIAHIPLLESLVSAKPAVYESVLRDLKRLKEVQQKPPRPLAMRDRLTAQQVTYTLRIKTLGPESIIRDGHAVSSSEWRATGAKEMFYYLLFVGPSSREDIGLVFWPESTTKQVRANFHTTLYRARAAVGENAIIFQDGTYRINPDLDLWCDALELETLTRRARLMPSRDARTEDLWRRAVALYQGDFLATLDVAWTDARRESLREAYIEALVGLGECARARKDYRESLSLFKQALSVDPYREDVHRAIMICYGEKGERNKILAHLQTLEQMLWEELSVHPSEETRALAQALLT
jgi:ATP/maltotriose-dependent transcriptional regulator MalT/DNA-binding SARP family transcriptional activator